MNILSFDTSTDICIAAFNQTYREERQPRQHLQLILPMIQSLMTEAGLEFSDLDAIAYGCGPGSFTGVRIATSVAQGLGFGAEVPLIPISSLAILAQSSGLPEVLIAQDARQGQAYFGHYRLFEGVAHPVQPDQLLAVSDLPVLTDICLLGNLWDLNSPNFREASVSPIALSCLARHYFKTGRKDVALEATPAYRKSSGD